MNNINQLVQHLTTDISPVKQAPHPLRISLSWVGVVLAYLIVLLTLKGLRPDFYQAMQHSLYVAELIALTVLFLTSAFSAALLSFPDLHQHRRWVLAPLPALAAFLIILIMSWRADSPPSPQPVHSFQCTLAIFQCSVLPGLAILLTMRRLASTHAKSAGAMACITAFCAGAIWLRLCEQNNSISHVVIYHYLPMIMVLWLGTLLGQRFLKW